MDKNSFKIEYSEAFKRKIESVFKYIVNELHNEIAAENLLQLAERKIIERSYNPKGYKSFKLDDRDTYIWYKIKINNYYAFYTVENNIMTMRRFIYSKRNLNNLLWNKLLWKI